MTEIASEKLDGADGATSQPEPDRQHSSLGRKPILDEDITRLHFHRSRTGVSTTRLLRGACDKPKGLNGALIDSWLNGKTRSARPEHVVYVLTRWAALPDGARVPLTQEMRAELERECSRTASGPYTILKRAADVPSNLTGAVISSWLIQSDLLTVNEVYWQYVMIRLRALPDAPDPIKPTRSLGPIWNLPDHRPISDEQLEELRFHRDRTGMGGNRLLNGATDKPTGLNSAMVTNWLGGTTRTALPEHIAYALARYREWQR